MSSQRILFLGGTGIISSACVARAVERGHDVTVLNRGESEVRPVPEGVRRITADLRSPETVRDALGAEDFDVVAEFVGFTPAQVAADIELFEGRTGQYVFISSAAAYQTPPARLPLTESTPLSNPVWQYGRDKAACEDLLVAAYRERAFPATIVRPSHTYDRTLLPTMGGWTDVARMRAGRPVIVHGDGTTQWTITHNTDFAVGLVGLLGRPEAVGDSFQITGDHAPTWNQIYEWLAHAAGVDADIVHVASETIARVVPELGPTLLGDKAHTKVFDNSKVKALVPEFRTTVPFSDGAREIVDWYDAHPERQLVDAQRDAAFDRLAAAARSF